MRPWAAERLDGLAPWSYSQQHLEEMNAANRVAVGEFFDHLDYLYNQGSAGEIRDFLGPKSVLLLISALSARYLGSGADTAGTFGAKSLGAAEYIPKLTKQMLSQSRVIARGHGIKDVARLVEKYGGKARDWIKKSTQKIDINGEAAEVHWYEAPGVGKVEHKVKWQ